VGRIPLNRIVAFAGPYVAILSGAVVDWLFVHLHFLSNFHTNKSSITTWLTQALVFGLTSILVWMGQQKWLSGWIAYEESHPEKEPT
jgi:high-affinity Fe2+/Pb2+ permease